MVALIDDIVCPSACEPAITQHMLMTHDATACCNQIVRLIAVIIRTLVLTCPLYTSIGL